LDDSTSFEDAATVPMATLVTMGLFRYVGHYKSGPWSPPREFPLVIYGASSAVGAAVIRLANIVNVHPLICVSGDGIPFVETLIDKSKGSVTIDYRGGPKSSATKFVISIPDMSDLKLYQDKRYE
jgi:NADPH2:quinone reductase